MKKVVCAGVLCCLVFLLAVQTVFAAETRIIRIKPVDDAFWTRYPQGAQGDAELFPAGDAIVICRMEDADFEVADLQEVQLTDSDEKAIPMVIDTSSILEEFGSIVAFTFAFSVDPASSSDLKYFVKWGGDVQADNPTVEVLSIDPARKESYRVGVVDVVSPSDMGGDSTFATIEVIADSSANYYYLAYLLPMAIIIGLLVVRKVALAKKEKSDARNER